MSNKIDILNALKSLSIAAKALKIAADLLDKAYKETDRPKLEVVKDE
jgi:hypothetical protein